MLTVVAHHDQPPSHRQQPQRCGWVAERHGFSLLPVGSAQGSNAAASQATGRIPIGGNIMERMDGRAVIKFGWLKLSGSKLPPPLIAKVQAERLESRK